MMYTYIMQRTQISLTAEERRALDEEAARTGRSISALIRDAVEIVYGVNRAVHGRTPRYLTSSAGTSAASPPAPARSKSCFPATIRCPDTEKAGSRKAWRR